MATHTRREIPPRSANRRASFISDGASCASIVRGQEETSYNEENDSQDTNSEPCKPLDWQGTHITTLFPFGYGFFLLLGTSRSQKRWPCRRKQVSAGISGGAAYKASRMHLLTAALLAAPNRDFPSFLPATCSQHRLIALARARPCSALPPLLITCG